MKIIQKNTCIEFTLTDAKLDLVGFGSLADVRLVGRYVRFVPAAEIERERQKTLRAKVNRILSSKEFKTCPFCGANNPSSTKTCKECQTWLP